LKEEEKKTSNRNKTTKIINIQRKKKMTITPIQMGGKQKLGIKKGI
jgi:hypothetical protein